MRILLDECVPAPLRHDLAGHEVGTASSVRWWGLKNGALLRQAVYEFDVFLTVGPSLVKQQNPPAELAIITVNASTNRLSSIRPLVPDILLMLGTIQPGDHLPVGP